MELDDLYRQYGQLMVNFELLQSQINNVKSVISQKLAQRTSEVDPDPKPVEESSQE